MSNEVEFEYTGKEEKRDIPKDVTIVRFHSSVMEVGDRVFEDCKQLKDVVLNEGLKKIGFRSFSHCKQLEHINLSSTVKEMGDYAFYGCSGLKDVVLNRGLQKIGQFSFHGCDNLEHITIPSTVTEIGFSAFCACMFEIVILNEGLQTIGPASFAHCTSLQCIIIPHTVTEISDCTFHNCRNMREVDLHEGIQKIHPRAFGICSSLERFNFPGLSTRLDTIIQASQAEAEDKVDEIRGPLERRGSEMFLSDKRLVQGRNWDILRSVFGRIDRVLTYYELREATALLELAIWKSKIDQVGENFISRDARRIDIPGPVKDTILQYLNFRVIGDSFLVERV